MCKIQNTTKNASCKNTTAFTLQSLSVCARTALCCVFWKISHGGLAPHFRACSTFDYGCYRPACFSTKQCTHPTNLVKYKYFMHTRHSCYETPYKFSSPKLVCLGQHRRHNPDVCDRRPPTRRSHYYRRRRSSRLRRHPGRVSSTASSAVSPS